MQDQQKNSRFSSGIVAGISVAVLAAGGITWWTINSSNSPTPTISNPNVTPSATVQHQSLEAVQIYWLNASGDEIELTPSTVTVENPADRGEVLETALRNLLEGPESETYTSTIPEGTQLLAMSIEEDGVHINLSQEFTSGGGSASMTGRLAQILYTATSLDPDGFVWIDIEGEPLELLGGEGLVVDRPMTRQSFEENFTL